MNNSSTLIQPIKKSYSQLMSEFPILYDRRKLDMSKTCMCWGIECPIGWYELIEDLSTKFEAMNIFAKPYKVAIQAEQVKEKFGELRFYHVVRTYGFDFSSVLSAPFKFLAWIAKPHGKNKDGKKRKFEIIQSEDLKTISVKKHKFRFAVWQKMLDVSDWIESNYRKNSEWRKNQKIIIHVMDLFATELINKASQRSYEVCQCCGREIGTSWSPRLESKGWIGYYCENCAREHQNEHAVFTYTKNNDGSEPMLDGKSLVGKELPK